MPRTITNLAAPKAPLPECTKFHITHIVVQFDDNGNRHGYVEVQFLSAAGDPTAVEQVQFNESQFGAWNGSEAQAIVFVQNNSKLING